MKLDLLKKVVGDKKEDLTEEALKLLGNSGDVTKVLSEFGTIKEKAADSKEALGLVGKLKDLIASKFGDKAGTILDAVGKLYGKGGDAAEKLDKTAGKGTASFVSKAIAKFLKK